VNGAIASSVGQSHAIYAAEQSSYIVAQSTDNTVSESLMERWRNDAHVTFRVFSYIPESDSFVAYFSLRVMPYHPIFRKDLSAESDQARDLFIKKHLSVASKFVAGGIDLATLAVPAVQNVEQLVNDIKTKSTVLLDWDIMADATDTGKLLAANSAAMRVFAAKGPIAITEGDVTKAPIVFFKDCEDNEAASRFLVEKWQIEKR